MKYYTYLWTSAIWKKRETLAKSGDVNLEYAAGNKFEASGVNKNSTIFIVTVKEGALFLGGRIVVADVVGKAEAAEHLGKDESELQDASEYVLAEEGTVMPFLTDLQVSDETVRGLEFAKTGGGFKNLKIDSEGKVNQQTLRNVRELYRGEHKKLADLLK